jgi:hypothetical protein
LFSKRQAMLHPWQATHFSKSITIDHLAILILQNLRIFQL